MKANPTNKDKDTRPSRNPPRVDKERARRTAQMFVDNLNKVVLEKDDLKKITPSNASTDSNELKGRLLVKSLEAIKEDMTMKDAQRLRMINKLPRRTK